MLMHAQRSTQRAGTNPRFGYKRPAKPLRAIASTYWRPHSRTTRRVVRWTKSSLGLKKYLQDGNIMVSLTRRRYKELRTCLHSLESFTDGQARILDYDEETMSEVRFELQPNAGLYEGAKYIFVVSIFYFFNIQIKWRYFQYLSILLVIDKHQYNTRLVINCLHYRTSGAPFANMVKL